MPTVSASHARGLRRLRADSSAIENALVRRSVGELGTGRPMCCHCHRTPLVGERVHYYDAGREEDVVCELCRPLRTAEPTRSAVVRSPEQAGSVRQVRART